MSEYLATQESLRTARAAARVLHRHTAALLADGLTPQEIGALERFFYEFLPDEEGAEE